MNIVNLTLLLVLLVAAMIVAGLMVLLGELEPGTVAATGVLVLAACYGLGRRPDPEAEARRQHRTTRPQV